MNRIFLPTITLFALININLSANKLHTAIQKMDIKTVEQMVQHDATILNKKDNEGKTAVHHAASLKIDCTSIEKFISSRAAIHHIFWLFHKHGANLHFPDNDQNTPLYYALMKENVISTGALVHFERKENINKKNFLINIENYLNNIQKLLMKLSLMKRKYTNNKLKLLITSRIIKEVTEYRDYIQHTCVNHEKPIIFTHMLPLENLPSDFDYLKEIAILEQQN